MQPIYDALEKKGIIGPKKKGPDGKLVWKEFDEYPKRVTTKGGKRLTVRSLVEEMEAVGSTESDAKMKDDPLAKEKRKLAEQTAEMLKVKLELEEQAKKMKETLAGINKDRDEARNPSVGSAVAAPAPEPITLAKPSLVAKDTTPKS